MFDDFIQEKNEAQDTEFSLSHASSFIHKLKFGAIFFLALSGIVWAMKGKSSSEGDTLELDQLQKRVIALEKTIQNLQESRSSYTTQTLATKSSPIHTDLFSTEEEQPLAGDDTSSFPKEIALELSTLFEQEMSNTPQQSPSSVEAISQLRLNTPYGSEIKNPQQAPSKGIQVRKYTVQKGDTLSKISLKFYGTSKKWKIILDANRDALEPNHVLRAGMLLTIPEK